MTVHDAPVLIVGGGPVGLGAALELARCGVRSIVVEKHASTSWHPKTRNLNTRTMEIARGWGAAAYERLRSIDTPPGWKSPIRFCDTAIGHEFGHIDTAGFVGPGPAISPAEPVMSSQELIEEIMADAARASGLVELRFSTEVTELVRGGGPDDRDVAIAVRSTADGTAGGTGAVLEGPALIAADGAASFVRSELGVALEGRTALSHMVNCYFRADIEPHLGDRTGVLFFVSNEGATGVLQPLDAAGRWLCQINVRPHEWVRERFDDDRVRSWVRAASGIADLDVDVLSVGLWQLNATVAERFVQGRVLLCGDAAHQFPPTGGLGVNTGLQGMANAVWKLAWYVRGIAGWPLVETYGTERRDVSQRITRQSLENSANVGRIRTAIMRGSSTGADTSGAGTTGLDPARIVAESHRYGNHLGVELGVTYRSGCVVGDGTDPPAVDDDFADYLPSATPGARAPHVWLGLPDARLSTLDLFGAGLTLLAAPAGGAWCAAAVEAGAALGVPVDCYRIGAPGLADLGGFADAYGLDDDGAVLVRPDGHVAWRSRTGPPAGASLHDVVERIARR